MQRSRALFSGRCSILLSFAVQNFIVEATDGVEAWERGYSCSDDSHLVQCFFHPGSDQELHDDAFEGCGLSPWKLNNAQGQYTFMALSF